MVPGDPVPKRARRLTRADTGLRYDMSQFYAMKDTLEALFGHPLYMKLKETAGIADWRKAIIRLLDAIALAINSTVKIADDDWRTTIAAEVDHGKQMIKLSNTIGDLFSTLSATLTKIVFLQIGFMPRRSSFRATVPLKPDCWTFDGYRSVQYVQSAAQKRALNAWVDRGHPAPHASKPK
jgi:hypothetical protein